MRNNYQDKSGGFLKIFGLRDPEKDLEKRIARL